MTTPDLVLPPPPASWDDARESRTHRRIAPCAIRPLEPAGAAFVARARRHASGRSLEEDYDIEEALREANAGDASLEEDEPETPRLLRSDPSNWKQQDHYAILGLSKLRYAATEDDIKRAYRRKVLKHHPDKKAAGGGKTDDDSFFKCVQKAWEVMSDVKRRREWDSCDPEFDDTIPSSKAKGDFFELYRPVFESESRFSKTKPVPSLGDMDSTRDEVNAFYQFWLEFESWRTFEMLDEEPADGSECREEKRYIERKNKAARAKLKKEDNARVNRLVEQAYSIDPRMRKFKDEEKAAKEAKKREKELVARSAEIEAAKKAEEERIAREAAEAEEKARQQVEKAKREQLKNAIRKEKKAIKRMLRDNNNFLPADASPDATISHMERVEFILERLSVEQLESFRVRLEEVLPNGVDSLLLVFDEEHLAVEEREAAQKAADAGAKVVEEDKQAVQTEKKSAWTPKEITILIKAVKLYPGGASARWEKISEYVNEHGGEEGESAEAKAVRVRTPKECILESKALQTAAAAERNRIQMNATKPVAKVNITDAPSERIEPLTGRNGNQNKAPSDINGTATTAPAAGPTMLAPVDPSWGLDQQVALEQALRKYPASAFTANPAERWEKIATEVPGKNKKEVKARVKSLAELAKKKKSK